MAHAVEANLFALFPLLATWPRAEAHDDPDMIWTLSDAPFPLFNSVLGAPHAFGTAFAEFASIVGLGSPSPLRHFLATIDGVPVATSSLFLGAGVGGVYDVATLPEWRRRGIGAAVTVATMNVARAEGYRIAILHSSPLGVGIYRSLGFQDCCRIGQYVWAP